MLLRASERGAGGLAALLSSGELDVAFLASSADPAPDLRVRELASSPLLLAVTDDHPWASRDSVELAELADQTFIDLPLGFGTRSIIDRAFADAGLERDVRFETVDVAAAAALVVNGLGVAFLPEFVVAAEPRLHALTVPGDTLRLTVSVAISKTRRHSRAARMLWELATGEAGPGGTA